MADLARRIDVPVALDFMAVSSYGSSTDSSGVVRILKDLDPESPQGHPDRRGHHRLRPHPELPPQEPAQPQAGSLGDLRAPPPSRRAGARRPSRYVGFEIPDKFVVGYGLDLADHFGTLDYIGVLTPEAAAEIVDQAGSLL